ncbi:hypothetical protein [Fodinibius halophilus]|uniref:Uncharacterized protein n=1 Tax=Fodinibius halophilus TaxID=1736908 RepID=A0A6M1SYQ6_9BACT|nr:hypothetical protein [Fodinibius halophilus]NGP89018.1 hypothetical protein [Fodinibius halophilus]
MDKRYRKIVFGLVLMILLTGCGIQMPVSEGLVFSSSSPYGQTHDEILPFIRYGASITLTSTLPGHIPLQNAAVDEYGSNQKRYLNDYFMTSVGNPGFGISFGNGRRVAIAFTPGYLVAGTHVDGTVRTFEKVFFTFNQNISINGGRELILQRPIWEKDGGGLSLGAFYRNQPMEFVEKEDQWDMGIADFKVPWYGVRLMGQTPDRYSKRAHVRGFISVGYVAEYKAPLLGVGIALSAD